MLNRRVEPTSGTPLAERCRLADHPYPPLYLPAFCDAVVVFYPAGAEPYEPLLRTATVVRYFRRGAPAAGYRRRDAHARRVDYAFESSPRAQAIQGALQHPPRCHGHAVAQGVRARCQGYKGRGYKGACEAETTAPANSGDLLIILCYSSPYRLQAPVDLVYYSKCRCGEANASSEALKLVGVRIV